ncbi:membrane protein [Geothrix limicola]|uniref:Membrane protein n=1 Tax=Geothrix limicola TaxID=2927978 RepID=A0ABQ5QGF9_9BACT|nr:TonB-dependent receptor [Geothrix limicola]GLH73521.1 membrane protein [Geothrix limicola]
MNRIFTRLGFTAAALVAGSGIVAHAQDSTTGAISGVVTGPNGAVVAGAKVILDGGRGQVVRVTDANGTFKASALIPGVYQITVTASGFETATKLTAQASINILTPVRVTMTKAAGAVVEVLATSQAVDTTTQTSGATFTSETVSSLPLGRSFSSVVNMAPGVASSGVDNNNPSVSGSSGLENAYVIDGVNTTGTGYGAAGAYSITWGSRGTGINTDFISEVQIKSFGLDAEFGGTTGGMVNAVTKSGDNTFRGQVFAYLDIDSLQARNKVPANLDPTLPIPNRFDNSDRQEFGFTVSGPIIKDKLFYFVGYNPIRNSQKYTQVDSRRLNYGTQFTRKQQTDTYYGKLNWVLTATQNLEFSIFGDPGKDPYQALNSAMSYLSNDKWSSLEYGSSNWNLKYNGVFFNDLLVEAHVAQTKNKFHQGLDPAVNNAFRVTDVNTGAPINGHGGPGFYENKDEKNRQYDIKITKTFGDLELKAGYTSEKLHYESGTYYQGPHGQVDTHAAAGGQAYSTGALINQRYYMIDPNAYTTDASGNKFTTAANIAPYYRVTRARFTPPAIAVDTPWDAYFIQAKYSLNNRLFIKAGFRWEEEDMQGRNETYKFKAADSMAPRISITWDPDGNGKNKIYAFYGKYFEKVPLDLAVRSLSHEVGTSRSDWYNLDAAGTTLSNPIQSGVSITDANPTTLKVGSATTTHYTGSSGFLTPVMEGTKLPYTNEYVLGWDSQLSEKVRVSNRLVHRTIGRVLEDMGIDGGNYLPYFIANPGENSWRIAQAALALEAAPAPDGYGVASPNLMGSGQTATWPKPVRDYWAWEFEANYNSAHWAGFFNLRLSRLEGNYEGLFRNDNGQSDPNITSLYDFSLEYMKNYETASATARFPSYTNDGDPGALISHPRGLTGEEAFASGPLPNDRAVIMNAGMSYNWDNGFATGFVVKIQTGSPLNKFYGLIDYDNAGELAAGGRGAMGRTPSTMNFDWTGSYTWKIKGTQSLNFKMDVFNLFNASKVTAYDQNYERSVDTINVNFMNISGYQTARRVRLGVKYQF